MQLTNSHTQFFEHQVFSKYLQRHVTVSVMLPAGYKGGHTSRLLLFNDGQDLGSHEMLEQFEAVYETGLLANVAVVGVHADHNRLQEYGTALKPDYAARGSRASDTTRFVTEELFAFLKQELQVNTSGVIYAGFSLGGLMALDIVWNHAAYFSGVAVFSGALWWRQKAIGEGYTDTDRIMHAQIRDSAEKPEVKFWFQTGTLDETGDRDGDGVIDSIQDTLECIAELEMKGYKWGEEIKYVEVKNGAHDLRTWAAVIPEFCQWAFNTH